MNAFFFGGDEFGAGENFFQNTDDFVDNSFSEGFNEIPSELDLHEFGLDDISHPSQEIIVQNHKAISTQDVRRDNMASDNGVTDYKKHLDCLKRAFKFPSIERKKAVKQALEHAERDMGSKFTDYLRGEEVNGEKLSFEDHKRLLQLAFKSQRALAIEAVTGSGYTLSTDFLEFLVEGDKKILLDSNDPANKQDSFLWFLFSRAHDNHVRKPSRAVIKQLLCQLSESDLKEVQGGMISLFGKKKGRKLKEDEVNKIFEEVWEEGNSLSTDLSRSIDESVCGKNSRSDLSDYSLFRDAIFAIHENAQKRPVKRKRAQTDNELPQSKVAKPNEANSAGVRLFRKNSGVMTTQYNKSKYDNTSTTKNSNCAKGVSSKKV